MGGERARSPMRLEAPNVGVSGAISLDRSPQTEMTAPSEKAKQAAVDAAGTVAVKVIFDFPLGAAVLHYHSVTRVRGIPFKD